MAMEKGLGTNLFVTVGTNLKVSLVDDDGNAVLVRATTAAIPSSVAGYAIGCQLQDATTGSMLLNRGTAASCTFVDNV